MSTVSVQLNGIMKSLSNDISKQQVMVITGCEHCAGLQLECNGGLPESDTRSLGYPPTLWTARSQILYTPCCHQPEHSEQQGPEISINQ